MASDPASPTPSPLSVEQVAERIRSAEQVGFLAGRTTLHEMLADQVELHRIPAWPEDGMRSKESFLSNWLAEAKAFEAAFAEYHQEDVVVSVDGERISLRRALCGTTLDGEPFRFTFGNAFIVRDGKVVAIDVEISPEARDELREIIRKSGAAHGDV
jgi:hypothetical protein